MSETQASATNCFGDNTEYDFAHIVSQLDRYLRLRTIPIGMKRYKTVAELEAVPRIRRPDPSEKFAPTRSSDKAAGWAGPSASPWTT